MKKLKILLIGCWICAALAAPAQALTLGGNAVGLELFTGRVSVAAIDEALGAPCREAGLQPGDELLSIDGREIARGEDVADALLRSKGTVELRISRDGEERTLRVSPQITADGPKLGLFLRQGVTGLGTATYYDESGGSFGALGHGVNDAQGKLLPITGGEVYNAKILSVRKGESGKPGQLLGALTGDTPVGQVQENREQGVFGTASAPEGAQEISAASAGEIHTGAATVRCTVSGTEAREYSVEILKIYPKANRSGRNLLLKVTDPALLEATGGIVQGMSGSPILQDGKLVGAVTHVLVGDPTTGYGIFIENMLAAAS